MTKMNVGILMALSLALIGGAGCSARSKLTPRRPLDARLGSYSSVLVSVESRVTEDAQKELSDLEGLVVSRVKSLNAFESVQLGAGADPPPGALLVNITISRLKKVGGTKRFMLGAFAGRASMSADVSFADAASGKVLGAFTVTGESGGSGYAGGTRDAVEKTAQGIADLISRNLGR
jgi:hypothetical protein